MKVMCFFMLQMSSIVNYRDVCKRCYFMHGHEHTWFFSTHFNDRKFLPCIWCKGSKNPKPRTVANVRAELVVPIVTGTHFSYYDKNSQRTTCFCPTCRASKRICTCINCVCYYERQGKLVILKELWEINPKWTFDFYTYLVYDEYNEIVDVARVRQNMNEKTRG